MKLSAGGRDYIVHLDYVYSAVDARKPTGVIARVHEGDCERPGEKERCTRPTASGQSVCHPLDQFVRSTGRKMALGRALIDLTSSKERRAALWADYRTKAR